MLSLRTPLLTLCISLSCVTSAATLISVSGYEGREVNISCPYYAGYESYEKYLCKNDCGYDDDVLIRTTDTKNNRFSIQDDKQKVVFTATISNLRLVDAGKYWCGVTMTGKDIYTEVKLKVRQDSCCNKVTKVQGHEKGSLSISCPYGPEDQGSLKYICRGKQPSMCLQQALITSDHTLDGQFRLNDDTPGNFTVTITGLTQKDSGSYLCGVHRNDGLDVFSAVELEVKEWCCVESNQMSGIAGHPVTIQCPYPPQHRDNRKFLCKGEHQNNCTHLAMSQSRFTLQEEFSSGSFLVVITELKAGDAGTYWCGSDSQWSVGNYLKIQLSVETVSLTVFQQQNGTVTIGSQSTHVAGEHIKDPVPSLAVVFTIPTVLLVLTFALVMVLTYKCHKKRGAEVKMDRNQTMAAEAEEVIDVADIYENGDVLVACSKMGTFMPQRTCYRNDEGEGQQESDYKNDNTTEDIYCNQYYHKSKK